MIKNEAANKRLYITAYALRSTALIACSGTLIQTFLTYIGFSASRVYLHSTVIQAVNVLIILLFARFADTKSIIKRSLISQLTGAVLFFAYIPLCIGKNADMLSFIFLLAVSILQAVTSALNTVCEYKLPYYILRKETYGAVTSVCGMLSFAISFSAGSVISALSLKISYDILMLFAFIISGVFLGISAFLTGRLKMICEMNEETENKRLFSDREFTKRVLLSPVFIKLLPANLIRGFSSGMTTVFAVIAADVLGYSENITSASVAVQAFTSFAACAVFGIMSKHISPRVPIFAGSMTFILMPLVLIPGSPVLFLIITGIIFFGRTLIDYAVPTLLLYAVESEIAGPYNAYRMILHSGGTLIATGLSAVLPANVLLITAAVSQLISGTVFFSHKILKDASPLRIHDQKKERQ